MTRWTRHASGRACCEIGTGLVDISALTDGAAAAARRAFVIAGTHEAGSVTARSFASRAEALADAAGAIAELGTGPLQPTGRVAAALERGQLLRTGDPAMLNEVEQTLRAGTVHTATKTRVGSGMNGTLYRYDVERADAASVAARHEVAVEKPAAAQAAQEEFAWQLARELGIDHLVAAVARRSDTGSAFIRFADGSRLSDAGIADVTSLEQALTASYLADASLGLTRSEAAQAGRIDRQLLQTYDYLLANNDRHAANGAIADAAAGRITMFDQSSLGQGAVGRGATALRPSLRMYQAGENGGEIALDDAVVGYLRRRLRPERITELHRSVLRESPVPGPPPGSEAERTLGYASSPEFERGMRDRLDQVLTHGRYSYVADLESGLRVADGGNPMDNAQGFAQVRAAAAGLDGFGGVEWY